jgi:hypothetical protein
MNERIEKLAEQAVLQANEVFDQKGKDYSGIVMEKFAELIVRECVNVLDKAQWDKGEDWICADGTRIIPQIKQHFGVEE